MHKNRLRYINAARKALADAGIAEQYPFECGLSEQAYQLNLRLWVLLHNGREYFTLSEADQKRHRFHSHWHARYQNKLKGEMFARCNNSLPLVD